MQLKPDVVAGPVNMQMQYNIWQQYENSCQVLKQVNHLVSH